MKKFLSNIEISVYIIFFVCMLSFVGAVTIYFMPEDYFQIHSQNLFDWMLQNKRIDTFWIYLAILSFSYLSITGIVCLTTDINKKNLLYAVFHISFLLVALSHLINSSYGYRILDKPIFKNQIYSFKTDTNVGSNFTLKSLDYKINEFRMPTDIEAKINVITNNKISEKSLQVNNPIGIDGHQIVLKRILSDSALLIDITYDPSIMIMFLASLLFTFFITVQAVKRFYIFIKIQNNQ